MVYSPIDITPKLIYEINIVYFPSENKLISQKLKKITTDNAPITNGRHKFTFI